MTTETAAAFFLLTGSAFMLFASIGAARLPDLFTRMHAITKAGTMGIGCVMLAVMFGYGDPATIVRSFVVILFVAMTAPVAAHMISRAAYIADVDLWHGTFVDHLREYMHGAHGDHDEREEHGGSQREAGSEKQAEGESGTDSHS